MSEYRAYIIGRDGHIEASKPMICADDDTAIATAQRFVNGHDVEVWQVDRKVITLAHKSE